MPAPVMVHSHTQKLTLERVADGLAGYPASGRLPVVVVGGTGLATRRRSIVPRFRRITLEEKSSAADGPSQPPVFVGVFVRRECGSRRDCRAAAAGFSFVSHQHKVTSPSIDGFIRGNEVVAGLRRETGRAVHHHGTRETFVASAPAVQRIAERLLLVARPACFSVVDIDSR